VRHSRSLRPSLTLLFAIGLAGAILAGGAPAARAGLVSRWGWVVARNPATASYTPSPVDRGNSSGSSVHVKRTGKGSYLVLFTGAGSSGGIAMATALGTLPRDCHTLWRPGVNGAEKVYVLCYDGTGAPADSRFVANYLNTPLPNGHDLAYLRDDQPSAVSYDPTAAYNSSGGTNHIDRTGTGQYTVTLPGLGGLDGNV
jgi:hypothetical protein